MIDHAEHMAAVLGLDARFLIMDAEETDFQDESFDVLVTRNLTWTLPHIARAYREWYRLLKPGGVLIMNAALGDGHGGESFFRWFADRSGPEEVIRDIEHVPPEDTHFDQWEAQILARILLKTTCIFVTGEENRDLVEKMYMRWAPDADTALAEAFDIVGREARGDPVGFAVCLEFRGCFMRS